VDAATRAAHREQVRLAHLLYNSVEGGHAIVPDKQGDPRSGRGVTRITIARLAARALLHRRFARRCAGTFFVANLDLRRCMYELSLHGSQAPVGHDLVASVPCGSREAACHALDLVLRRKPPPGRRRDGHPR
jgi:hypothetical protein